MIYGNLSKADDLSSVNNHQSGGSPYTQTTPIAKRAVSYGGEVGFNLRAVCKDNMSVPVIYPFVRYEYYNPQEKGRRQAHDGFTQQSKHVDSRSQLVCFT